MIHYGPANVVDPHDTILMGYSESNTWTLANADVPAHEPGDKINFYVQTYDELGQGENDIEKAQYLHDGEFTGSAWSDKLEIIFE